MATAKKMTVEGVKGAVMSRLDKSRKQAEKEIAKVKKTVDMTLKKTEDFMKKNPEKAAAIAAGIGAALGAAAAFLLSGGKKKK